MKWINSNFKKIKIGGNFMPNVVGNVLTVAQNYLGAAFYQPTREEWATPNQIVLSYQTLNLRFFKKKGAKKTVVILPPQAGHASTLADYQPGQSLVELWQNRGYNVFVTEWLPATKEYRNLGIFDYIRLTDMAVDRARKITGARKIILVGECQGGWQAAIYACMYKKKISGLVIAAAPIDLNAEISFFTLIAQAPKEYYRLTVDACSGLMPGKFMLTGFKALQPYEHYVLKYFNIFAMSLRDDEEGLLRHKRFTNWYETPQDLPGQFYLEAVEHIFKNNCLTKPGSLIIDNQPIDLRDIKCPLVLIGGSKDHITPPEQVFAMEGLVGSKRILKILVPDCGHIGTLMGTKSLAGVWPRAIDFF